MVSPDEVDQDMEEIKRLDRAASDPRRVEPGRRGVEQGKKARHRGVRDRRERRGRRRRSMFRFGVGGGD